MPAPRTPNAKHPYHAFLSYSHKDKALVDQIHRWLEAAGLRIYQDVVQGDVAGSLPDNLAKRIEESWSLVVFFSEHSANSAWVKLEWEYGLMRAQQVDGFRVVPVRIGDVPLPGFLQTAKCIEMPDGKFTLSTAVEILDGVSGANNGANNAVGRDIYVARSWREGKAEFEYADGICKRLHDEGFRLIGDAEGHFDGYDKERIRQLIESCAGFVAILPHRGQGKTSSEMLDEVTIAKRLGLPALLIADDDVKECPDWPGNDWHSAAKLDPTVEEDEHLSAAIEQFMAEVLDFRKACFYLAPADHFKAQFGDQDRAVPRLLERVTRIPCYLAKTNKNSPFQQNALAKLKSAVGVLTDLTSQPEVGLVNIGAALGADRPVHVSIDAKAGTTQANRVLLGIPATNEYSTPEELLGIVYYAATRYRRQVYNDLLTNS